jgi:7-cyano-7-deazaguanine synthase
MDTLLLFSGGLDSTVLLGYILSLGKNCIALSFDYGQRHKQELLSAKKIAAHYSVEHLSIHIDPLLFSAAHSSLTNCTLDVTPETAYVPARNLLFLAHAISFAESRNIPEIYIGANAQDTSHFPDCTRAFFDSLQATASLGMKAPISILTPFSSFSKKEIIDLGKQLSVPIELSFSCYDPKESKPCGICPACVLRGTA